MNYRIIDAGIILAASLLALSALLSTSLDAGLVGLVLTYALNTSDSLVRLFGMRTFFSLQLKIFFSRQNGQNWLVRSVSEVEQNIVSVERLLSYIRLSPEAPYEIEGAVDETWPSRGHIEFCQYSVKYRPGLELALKEISLVIVCLKLA
jgi:ATP-binding cassette, subfamily C (CFTR/MRP), member 1